MTTVCQVDSLLLQGTVHPQERITIYSIYHYQQSLSKTKITDLNITF